MVVHTAGAVTGEDNVDEMWVWAVPLTTTTGLKQLNLQHGTSSTADIMQMQLAFDPANPAPKLVLQGIGLNNSLVLSAWASSCAAFSLVGHAFQVRG